MEEPNIIQSAVHFAVHSTMQSTVQSAVHYAVHYAVQCTSNLPDFIDTLTDSDFLDLEITVIEMTDEYIQNNILQMADPDFHQALVNNITEILFAEWSDSGLCLNEDFEDIITLIEQFADNYFDNYLSVEPGIIPPVRSHRTTLILQSSTINSETITNTIERLKSIEQPAQRTPEWYAFRNELITASNLGKIFISDAQRNSLIFEKCSSGLRCTEQSGDHQLNLDGDKAINNNQKHINTQSPMHWGQKYEPVSVMMYEHLFGTKISADFGCIRHPTIPCIGASPDGINIDPLSDRYGRMLEIKNIVNREMDGIPSKAYWIQMQVQMETCDLDECDFMETRFKEYNDPQISTEDAFWADTVHEYKGIILYFVERVSIGSFVHGQQNMNAPHYEYMPFSIPLTRDSVDEWIASIRQRLRRSHSLYTTLYWYLDDWSCVLVERNRMWFAKAKDQIIQTWDTILLERETGYEHRASKKRVIKPTSEQLIVVDEDGNTRHIQNVSVQKSICLVKLDHDDI